MKRPGVIAGLIVLVGAVAWLLLDDRQCRPPLPVDAPHPGSQDHPAPPRHGPAVGAHPGFPDLIGFGRRNLDATPQEIYDLVVYQVGALLGFSAAAATI